MVEIKSWRFLGGWLVGSVLVYPMAGIALAAVLGLLSMLMNMFGIRYIQYPHPLVQLVVAGGLAALIGTVIGICVGIIQRTLLRRYLCWTADYWRRYTALGGALGAVLVVGAFMAVSELVPDHLAEQLTSEGLPLLTMPFFMAGVSFLQWRALRQATRGAALWILANIVAGIVFGGLIVMNQPPMYTRNYSTIMLGLVSLAVLVQGLITGFVMMWFFERLAYPIGEPEPVPVRVRVDEEYPRQ
jgi:hypothetical protein